MDCPRPLLTDHGAWHCQMPTANYRSWPSEPNDGSATMNTRILRGLRVADGVLTATGRVSHAHEATRGPWATGLGRLAPLSGLRWLGFQPWVVEPRLTQSTLSPQLNPPAPWRSDQ